jgi:ABC-type transporter MlaC component
VPLHWISCVLVGLLVLFSPAASAAPQPAAAGAEAKATEAVSRIRGLAVEIERETAPREVERRKFNELRSHIDGEAIALFVLGPRLNNATPPQRAAATSAITDLVADGLVERLGGAHAEPFELGEARRLDNGDVVVVSHLRFRDGRRGELDWRMRPKGDAYAMVDVLVEGVSVAVGARDQAQQELLANGGSLPQLSASMKNRLRFK